MTTLDSFSAAESSMEDASNQSANRKRHHKRLDEGDGEAWATFNSSFEEVQSVLDRNRALIQQVNENHQSKVPDNMVKNVALIQEINGNINKVAALYSDLSTNFISACHHQRNKK